MKPRGTLLLTLLPSEEPDPRVKLLRVSDAPDDDLAPAEGAPKPRVSLPIVIGVVVVALWILILIWLRLSGQG